MNVLFISIDSLNRHFLKAYGQPIEIDVQTPNLDHFAARSAVFDTHYAGSLPCMPARREFFAGVQEFLWRPWGPMEPFDVPMARAARRAGAVTALTTDHYHYFQHGSHGYYEDYQGYEFIRGHEYDAWKTSPRNPDPALMAQINGNDAYSTEFMTKATYARNVSYCKREDDFFAPRVFSAASNWVDANKDHPKWMLVVDSFDVHEPFHCPAPYNGMYTNEDPHDPEMPLWPTYGRIDSGASKLTERQVAFVRSQFAGKMTMVDRWFGRLMDTLTRLNLWDDTMVIVTADHGHYLGDHGWMGKPEAPLYNTLAHTPLFVWYPHSPLMRTRVPALTSAVDLYATVLEALEADIPEKTHSRSLMPLLTGKATAHRDWALYGYWGSTVNVTDGRYTYLHPCRSDEPAWCYSTQFMNPYNWFGPSEPPTDVTAGPFLPYTNVSTWRYALESRNRHPAPMLFDVLADPNQEHDLGGQANPEEARMRALLETALTEVQAPEQHRERLGLA